MLEKSVIETLWYVAYFNWFHIHVCLCISNCMYFYFSKVDSNKDYDSMDLLERDEQDKYFDEEESQDCSDIRDSIMCEAGDR